jgi:hypothetical protein
VGPCDPLHRCPEASCGNRHFQTAKDLRRHTNTVHSGLDRPGLRFLAPLPSSRPVRLNSSGGTTVSDISENDTSLPRVHWSVLVLCNLPGRLEPWDPSIWRGYFGELKGLDLLKLGAEPGVLGGLTDTGGLNSLLKFFHVMGDFG